MVRTLNQPTARHQDSDALLDGNQFPSTSPLFAAVLICLLIITSASFPWESSFYCQQRLEQYDHLLLIPVLLLTWMEFWVSHFMVFQNKANQPLSPLSPWAIILFHNWPLGINSTQVALPSPCACHHWLSLPQPHAWRVWSTTPFSTPLGPFILISLQLTSFTLQWLPVTFKYPFL